MVEREYDKRDYRYKKKVAAERRAKGFAALKRVFKRGRGRKKRTKGRQVAARRLLAAAGVIAGGATQTGPGRPRGTGKFQRMGFEGVHDYKRYLARRKEQQRQFQEEQAGRFKRRGITREQLQRMQLARTIEEGPQAPQQQQVVLKREDIPERAVDDELAFKRWEAKRTLSPSAQRILTRLRRVQNKGKMDNIRQQRIQEERRMISHKSNLFDAHKNMVDVRMDFTGVTGENILNAPSIFRDNPEENILRTKRFNIMQTREAGNSLDFF